MKQVQGAPLEEPRDLTSQTTQPCSKAAASSSELVQSCEVETTHEIADKMDVKAEAPASQPSGLQPTAPEDCRPSLPSEDAKANEVESAHPAATTDEEKTAVEEPAGKSTPGCEDQQEPSSLKGIRDSPDQTSDRPEVAPVDLNEHDVEPGNYLVQLIRADPAEKWGFVWDPQAMKQLDIRILQKVSPNSLVADWGRRFPGRDARKGDQLVKVNGVSGSTELMGQEFKKNRVFCEFKPAEPRDAASAEVLNQSNQPSSPRKMRVDLAPLKAPAVLPRLNAPIILPSPESPVKLDSQPEVQSADCV